MDDVVIGALAWLSTSALTAGLWSRFYGRIARDHTGLDVD
jgi:hypothetical protein